MAVRDRRHTGGSSAQSRFGQFGGMGIAGGVAGDGAQAETQRSVEASRANPAVIEADLLAFAVFQIQLPIVGVRQRRGQGAFRCRAIQCGIRTLEEQPVGFDEWGHGGIPRK